MIAGVRTQRKRQAEAYVKEQLLPLSPGESLPSIRTMMKESGLGRVALDAAIKGMVERGLLETKKRSGICRTLNQDTSVSANVADIVFCSEINSLGGVFFSTLAERLADEATKRGFSVRTHRIPLSAMASEYKTLIERVKIRNAILVTPQSEEIPKVFEHAMVNWISLFPRYLPSEGPAIADSPEAVPMQMKHLIGLGHCRIACIGELDMRAPSYTYLQRRESYYRIMAEHGFRIQSEWAAAGSYNEKELFAQLDAMFAKKPCPTAVIAPDRTIPSLYEWLDRNGFAVGKDVSVIGFDCLETNESLRPHPASLVNSRALIAEMTWDALSAIAEGRKVKEIWHVPLSFCAGESVAPPED